MSTAQNAIAPQAQRPVLHNVPATHKIRSVSILGGFLDGQTFDFTDGLNCLIGARGAGKTTVVELVRYALDAMPSRETAPTERRRIESLVQRNLADGRIEVTIETKDGLTYIVSRTVGEEPMVLAKDREPTEITLAGSGLFRADIFSQNEVESIADRTTSQLELIDNFQPEEIAQVQQRLQRLRADLAANANEIVPLELRIRSLAEQQSTLAGLEDKLKQLATTASDQSPAINKAHGLKSLRDRERRCVDEYAQMLEAVGTEIGQLQKHVARHASNQPDRELLQGPNGQCVLGVATTAGECFEEVQDLLSQASATVTKRLNVIAAIAKQLKTAHKQQELTFRSLIEKHQHAQGQAAERARLERRRNELLAKQRTERQLREQMSELLAQRQEMLIQLSDLLDQRFAIRKGIVRRINESLGPAIRVSVLQFGDPTLYRQELESRLRSARVHHRIVAQKLAEAFWPADLTAIVRRGDTDSLIDRAELNSDQAEKVVAALSDLAFLFQLESIDLIDLPMIELKDGATYKDSLTLSTGQKCTTILPILLLDSDNPLLVDQPEDNLDNRFIFETLVDSLRKVKVRRQLIFVTHNPNIPVLGDAERVFVLDSDGTASRTVNEGTVDECKQDIVTLLEGGEDAFKARKNRYAY